MSEQLPDPTDSVIKSPAQAAAFLDDIAHTFSTFAMLNEALGETKLPVTNENLRGLAVQFTRCAAQLDVKSERAS